MASCLVTGGAGFLGAHLTAALLHRGHFVRVLDSFCAGPVPQLVQDYLGITDAGRSVVQRNGLEVLHGDITCFDTVRTATRDIDQVFHLAALGTRLADASEPREIQLAGETGTLRVLEAARLARVQRVVYASTAQVYGAPTRSPVHEDDPTCPQSAYGASKLAGELHCLAYTRTHGLSTVGLRYFNLFGPGQPWNSRYGQGFRRMLAAAVTRDRQRLTENGWDCSELLYVEDAVHAAVLAAETDRLAARVYNIGRGRRVRPARVLHLLQQLVDVELPPKRTALRPAGDQGFLADITRAEAELGYCPANGLTQAVRACLDYYTLHPEELNAPGACVAVLR